MRANTHAVVVLSCTLAVAENIVPNFCWIISLGIGTSPLKFNVSSYQRKLKIFLKKGEQVAIPPTDSYRAKYIKIHNPFCIPMFFLLIIFNRFLNRKR